MGGLLAVEHAVPLRCREADRAVRGRRDGEEHDRLPLEQRHHDMDVAYGKVVGELTALKENGSLAEDVEPALTAADLVAR